MKKSYSILFLLMCLYLPKCGVHIGNGMKTYQSKFGYEFKYASSLKVEEKEGGRTVRINNEQNLQSFMNIDVVPGQTVTTLEDLNRIGRSEIRSLIVSDFNLGGQPALKSELKSESFFQMLIFSSNLKKQLVRVNVSAYQDGDGIKAMNDVLNSFRFTKN